MNNNVSPEELEIKKQKYIKSKDILTSYLKELLVSLDSLDAEPMTGDIRKTFLEKFSMVDHRLLDNFDVSSYEYFEGLEQSKQ